MAAPNEHEPVFDAEPVRELPPGEPVTPMWMPILGAALFGAAALYLMATSASTDAKEAAASASARAAASAMAPPVPATVPPTLPTGASPDQIRDVRNQLLQARERQQPGAAPQAAPTQMPAVPPKAAAPPVVAPKAPTPQAPPKK